MLDKFGRGNPLTPRPALQRAAEIAVIITAIVSVISLAFLICERAF